MQDIAKSFTPEQILFLKDAVFDTLATHFSYPLSEPKRKKALAIAFEAERHNFDALLQRAKRTSARTAAQDAQITALRSALRKLPAGIQPFEASVDNLRPADFNYLLATHAVALTPAVHPSILARIARPEDMEKLLDVICPVSHATLFILIKAAIEAGHATVHITSTPATDLDNDLGDFSLDLSNDNCLRDLRCPCCASEDRFRIETEGVDPEAYHTPELADSVIRYLAIWTDDGAEDSYGDTLFPKGADCRCLQCQHQQPIEAFYERAQD